MLARWWVTGDQTDQELNSLPSALEDSKYLDETTDVVDLIAECIVCPSVLIKQMHVEVLHACVPLICLSANLPCHIHRWS